jgi:hypothetical protein
MKLTTLSVLYLSAVPFGTGLLAADPNFEGVLAVTVKADRVGDFEAVIKDFNAIAKKANLSRPGLVAQSMTGQPMYLLVQPAEKISELNTDAPPPELQAHMMELVPLFSRVGSSIEKTERVILHLERDLSIQPAPNGRLPGCSSARA